MSPLYIRVHPADNVAIIVDPEGAAAGRVSDSGLTVREHTPQSHKISLTRIEAGQPVLRYGQIIGRANRTIEPGHWVREEMIELPGAPKLDELPLAIAPVHTYGVFLRREARSSWIKEGG